jgi:hypothetical protein
MYIVRFNKEALRVNICNLYPGLELTSPVYYSNGTTCHVSPSQQIDASTTTEASFGIDFQQKDVKGALLYKLQRKYATRTDNNSNSSIVSIENTETNIYLLVVWEVKNHCDEFYVCLIECSDDFTWDKLWALCHQYNDQFLKDYNYSEITWLIHDDIAMKTRRRVTYGSDYKLDIFISEETGLYNMFKPMKIDTERLVLPLLMLIVLTYAVSLCIQPSFKLNIHNLYFDVDLVSPIYITGDGLEFHRPLDYKVYAGDTMGSGFIINKSDDESYGVLIYKLQRRQSHESTEIGEDTSIDVHLLVIWCIPKPNELYADVLLVEHAKAFTWNRNKLNKLYHENHDRLKGCNNTILNTWFMDNNMVLKTVFSARDLKGNPELSISISEEKKRDDTMRPFCVNLKR